jgi:hypothetical protein
MKHIFTSFLSFLFIIALNSCGDDGVVKPGGTTATGTNIGKSCYMKSFKYADEDFMSLTFNAKNQIDKITLTSFFSDLEATFTYNTDGTVSKIGTADLDYEFVYEKGIITKINEKEGKVLVGERILTSSGGKVASVAYYSVSGTVKNLEYTHKFSYTKEGNISKYILNVSKVDLPYFEEVVYDTKPNGFKPFKIAGEAFLYAMTDEFLFFPSEMMTNFGSVNNVTAGKYRPEIITYLFSLEENETPTIAGLNKGAPLLPFTSVSILNQDNFPTKTTIKYKDPVSGDESYVSEFVYDCK